MTICERCKSIGHCALVPPILVFCFCFVMFVLLVPLLLLAVMNMKPQCVDHILMNIQLSWLIYSLTYMHTQASTLRQHTSLRTHSFPIKSFHFLIFVSFACFQQRSEPSLWFSLVCFSFFLYSCISVGSLFALV